jgi:hypothetical protein
LGDRAGGAPDGGDMDRQVGAVALELIEEWCMAEEMR